MKTAALQRLRQQLTAGRPVYGMLVTLESASVTEMAVALGLDWVIIDAEHGQLDWQTILEHLRATVRSHTVALVRLAEANAGLVKRALDLGADGVVLPSIETADQLRAAVAMAHYPPEGVRGIGAERATGWGRAMAAHVAEANEHVLVVPIFETVTAAAHIDELCRVPGVELALIGPADFSASAGHRGQWQGPGVAEQLTTIKDTLRRHGKHCGVFATSNEDLLNRRAEGYTMLGLGLDGGLLLRSLSDALQAVGRESVITPDLVPHARRPDEA